LAIEKVVENAKTRNATLCFRATFAFADCRAEPGRRGTDYYLGLG
jgi:hypothetical protein